MAKKDAASYPPDISVEDFQAQEPCPECGARKGRDPATGIVVKDGHTYECHSLAARVARGESV